MRRTELIDKLKPEKSFNEFFSMKDAIIFFLEHPDEYDYEPEMHPEG